MPITIPSFAGRILPMSCLASAVWAGAGEIQVRGEMVADDLEVQAQHTEIAYRTPGLGGTARIRLVGVRWDSPELSGVASQEHVNVGGSAGETWTLGNLALDLEAGFFAVDRPESWGVAVSGSWLFASGWKASLSPSTGELDGLMSQGVRSNAIASSLGWSGERTWAELGGRWESRTGGTVPERSLPVELPDNEIHQVWSWVAREVAAGVVLGVSGTWADSREETRQATGVRNDTLLWLDVPYRSPHEEGAVEAVVRLRRWGASLESTWPVWSTSRRRVESPWIADSPWSYTIEHCGLAEVKLGWDGRAGSTAIGLEAFGRSRPYASGAWFTDRAWNQFGIAVRVGLPIPPHKESQP